MDTTAHLPPLAEDEARALRRILPPHLDYREFRRIPHNPDRYAISLLDGSVWDFYRACYLTPQTDKDGRRRVRIVHPNAEARWIYRNVILALVVLGPPPTPTAQAHHLNEDPTDDRADNIAWQTPKQNRTRAAKHQAQRRRLGTANGKTTLTAEKLDLFIRRYDEDYCKHRRIDWEMFAFWADVSERQLRRIAQGKSRIEEVARIRHQIAEENKNAQ